jgi:glycosyltransferase involved in cell wall biosynthesis
MLQTFVRSAARSVRTASAHAGGAAAYVAGAPAGAARVSYGQRVPAEDEIALGGIVKLQHLTRLFPEAGPRFNVLYFVSSRLPPAALVRAEWARRKGARLVINQNGVAYPGWHGPGWERVNAPMTALLARADYVFYQSEFCRTSADRFAGPALGACEVLHNAVDTSRFTPGPKRAGRPLTLLIGGSQAQWYRLDAAVRTLGVLVRRGIDAELLVAGSLRWTTNAAAARRQADTLVSTLRLDGRVMFLGPYAQAEAPSIIRRADIVLHTKYNDPCPTAVLEALACGRPVVYSRSGGVPELVGEAGIGIDAELSWERDIAPDPEALADAVVLVRERLTEYAQAARLRAVERFDLRLWMARHAQVFKGLVG